jgi:hypothetical protein
MANIGNTIASTMEITTMQATPISAAMSADFAFLGNVVCEVAKTMMPTRGISQHKNFMPPLRTSGASGVAGVLTGADASAVPQLSQDTALSGLGFPHFVQVAMLSPPCKFMFTGHIALMNPSEL